MTEDPKRSARIRLAEGDYVLATKYDDGDPGDHWAVGFFDSMLGDRYMIVDGNGDQFRGNGFRRCEKITSEQGEWMVFNIEFLSDPDRFFTFDEDGELQGKSIWDYARAALRVIGNG